VARRRRRAIFVQIIWAQTKSTARFLGVILYFDCLPKRAGRHNCPQRTATPSKNSFPIVADDRRMDANSIQPADFKGE